MYFSLKFTPEANYFFPDDFFLDEGNILLGEKQWNSIY